MGSGVATGEGVGDGAALEGTTPAGDRRWWCPALEGPADEQATRTKSARARARWRAEEGIDRKLYIDPNECIDCGACEPECPVNAIFPEESVPAEWVQYTPIDAVWFTDRAAARTQVDELKPR